MRAVLLSCLLALLAAAPAGAAFSGSTGQVAYLTEGGGLVIDDPFDDEPAGAPIAQATEGDGENGAMTPQSPPQWSPDGTRLLYTEGVANGEFPYEHSAVFVINRDGSGRRQVTTPFPGKKASCPTCKDEEAAWDTSPVWKDDDTIAFVRWVSAGDDASHESQEGTSVRTASAGGGGDSLMRHYPNENKEAVLGLVWPSGWTEPVATYAHAQGFKLLRAESGTVLASAPGITDVDASPDGEKLSYVGLGGSNGFRVVTTDRHGNVLDSFSPGVGHPNWVRFTPDGNGLAIPGCAEDRDGGQRCGLLTHRLPDADADVRPDEPVEAPLLDLDVTEMAFPDIPGNRSMFDIQSQDLPVIYIPGFLGSQILCDGESVWMPTLPPLDFEPMQLESDGKTNATCAGAIPSGEVVESFMLADVYGHANDWLEGMNPPGGWATYGWDWRKAPQESLADLDGLIDSMVLNDLPAAQGAKRVSMVGHSYGALLMRTYVDEEPRAKKVARMLTVGAPYWGSPKPLFSIAFGMELPSFSAIDLMADNDDLRDFARNMAGIYHLLPSDNYGDWLRLNGSQLDQAGAADWIETVAQGNRALHESALTHHRENIDGFYDRGGRIDYRAVVGVGLQTIGQVNLVSPGPDGETVTAGVRYENGDGTVTGRSATQGPIGTLDPLGDDVHIQNRCGIAHMDQTKDEVVQEAYDEFLVTGRLPRKLPPPNCDPEGREIEVFHGLEVEPPTGADGPLARGAAMKLGDAALRDLADVVQLPGSTLIVTDDSRPVDLTFEADGLTFGVTDLAGSERGEQRTVGPVTGTVVLGGDGVITVDGVTVTPVGAEPAPGPVPSSGGATPPAGQPSTTPVVATDRCGPARKALAKASKRLKKARKAVRKRPTQASRRKLAKARKAKRSAAARVRARC